MYLAFCFVTIRCPPRRFCRELHLQLGQHFGDADGVEGRTGEALFAEVVERGPDMNERLAVDDEVAVVESLGLLDRKRVLVLRVEHLHVHIRQELSAALALHDHRPNLICQIGISSFQRRLSSAET